LKLFDNIETGESVRMDNSKYGKYIVSTLQPSASFTPEVQARYSKFAKKILWMDENVVEGAFQMNCSWYMKTPEAGTGQARAHSHDETEILGFFGSNPADPYDLGGEVELWLEDEMHLITRSSMVFIPTGMKHCPLILRRVDRPIFHFSTLTGGKYEMKLL
jgi:hypothetical protein